MTSSRAGERDDVVVVVPEEKDQRIVRTPYGRGLVVRVRRPPRRPPNEKSSSPSVAAAVQEVQLLEWDAGVVVASGGRGRSRRGPPVLYTSNELESVTPMVGDDAICQYGRGRVVKIVDVPVVASEKETTKKIETNDDDDDDDGGDEEKKEPASPSSSSSPRIPPAKSIPDRRRLQKKYVVKLTSWRLAGRSTVLCHLTGPKSLSVVRKKTLREMDAHERVEHASSKKSSANPQFVAKRYELALKLYAEAVDAVRYVQHDSNSSNELRADLVEVMVTCSNNAATCCVRLKRWSEASRYAKNALVLLDALDGKRGMRIHKVLNRSGIPDARLFGEWRAKSYLVGARSYAEWGEHEKAIESLKSAKKVIGEFYPPPKKPTAETAGEEEEEATDAATRTSLKHLAAQEKEIARLMATCVQRRKLERKKERQRAKAMFGGGAGTSKTKGASDGDAKGTSPTVGGDDDATTAATSALDASGPDVAIDQMAKKGQSNDVVVVDAARSKKDAATADAGKRSPVLARRVSFASDVKGSFDAYDETEEEEEEPWYREHAEALILVGAVAGLAGLASVLMLRGGGKGGR